MKLEQLFVKFPKLLTLPPRKICVDLGCYPGSWLQVLSRRVRGNAKIYGFDLLEIENVGSLKHVDGNRTETFRCDVFESDSIFNELQLKKNVSLLTSDMMAKTTGHNDAIASTELAAKAFELGTKDLLAKNGNFVCKIFESEETRALKTEARKAFATAALFRPDAVRKGSREIYMVGLGFKG